MTIKELDDKLNSPGFQDTENGDLFYNFFIYQYPAEKEYDIRRQITEFKAKRVHEITGRGKVYTIDMRLYPQYTIRIGDYIKIDDTEGVVRGIECLGSNPEIGVLLRETSEKVGNR